MKLFENCNECIYKVDLKTDRTRNHCRRFPPQSTGIPDGTGRDCYWEFPPAYYRCGEYVQELSKECTCHNHPDYCEKHAA